MDPLSMTASIIAILELTATFTSYINDVRNATKEQAKVAVEASSLYGLLTGLRFRVEAARSSDPWFNQVKLLGQQNGPLDQFKEVLEKMVTQIAGSRKRDQVKSALMWKVTKAQIEDALGRIERLKSLVLCALTGDLSTLTQAIHDEVGNLGRQMEQLHVQTNWLHTRADQELRHRLVQWLGVPDPSTNYQAALRRRHPDTGLWLINSRQFAEWKISDCSLMWLHGNAGCGKTILSAAALQEVLQLQSLQPDIAVAYFYFDFNETNKQWSKEAIRSLLCQVASHTSDSLQGLQQLYQRCGNGQHQPSDDAIQLVLNETLTSLGSICIVLDALDECADREDFVTFLCCLVDRKFPGLRVLATSRRERDIEEQLRPIATARINIQSAIVDEDIRLYVQSRLRTDAKLRKWPDAVHDEISSVLMEKANGMFRWVYCQLESIRHCVKLRGLREALSSLPKTLDDTYERILQDLESRGQLQDAITVLRWLCFSPRPLRLLEVVEVLAVETGDGGGFFPDERLPDPADVLVVCSSLISYHSVANEDNDYDNESGEVDDNADSDNTPAQAMMIRLAHFSVKEYLLSEHCALRSQFQTSPSHQLIAEGCLQYLLYTAEQGPLTEAIVFEHPLARYAAEHWWQHARHVHDVDRQGVVRLASRLLTSDDVSLLLWVQLYNPETPWRYTDTSLTLADVAPALYYTGLVGLPDIVGAVLDQGADVHAQGGQFGNALQAASVGGDEKVVQMLLDAGADVHAQGGQFGNALQAASARGHEKVVQMLLDAGADVHVQGGQFGNALQAASEGGHEKVVQMLLDAGADVHAQGGGYGSALQAASVRGRKRVVQMLLDAGADVHAQGGQFGNALQAASARGHEKVVQMLLDAGADVHVQGGLYGNALQAASFGSHEKVVQMLLDAGADVHAQGGDFGNTLQAASVGGDEKVVQMLLDAGADIHAQGGQSGNALQAASEGGHEKVVQMLLDAGADVHAQVGEDLRRCGA